MGFYNNLSQTSNIDEIQSSLDVPKPRLQDMRIRLDNFSPRTQDAELSPVLRQFLEGLEQQRKDARREYSEGLRRVIQR